MQAVKLKFWEASLVNGWFWFFVHTSVDVAFDFKKLGPLKTRVSRPRSSALSFRFLSRAVEIIWIIWISMHPRILPSLLRGPLRARRTTQLTNNWVCQSCRAEALPQARFSSSDRSPKKPYYITTPIFYVNAGKKGYEIPTYSNVCANDTSY